MIHQLTLEFDRNFIQVHEFERMFIQAQCIQVRFWCPETVKDCKRDHGRRNLHSPTLWSQIKTPLSLCKTFFYLVLKQPFPSPLASSSTIGVPIVPLASFTSLSICRLFLLPEWGNAVLGIQHSFQTWFILRKKAICRTHSIVNLICGHDIATLIMLVNPCESELKSLEIWLLVPKFYWFQDHSIYSH